MAAENADKKVVEDFLASFSIGDVDAILDRMAEGATWWVSGTIAGLSGTYGKHQLAPLLRAAKRLYKTGALRITPSSMVAESGFVATEAESFAELTDGRTYNNRYHFLLRVDNGKIAEVREYMDTLHAYDIFIAPLAK